MIVGGGMMARAFAPYLDDPDVVIFASGVANSLETRADAFARERLLLTATREEHANKPLVYFGTCSVDDPDRRPTPYVAHKMQMEAILQASPSPWLVLRVPLAIGPAHRGHTLVPFLFDRITRGEPFEVWENATRYPVDVADVLRIAQHMIGARSQWNRMINVALRAFPVVEFVRVMESILGRSARYRRVPKGQHYAIDCPEVKALAQELNLDYSESYLDRVLRKHYAAAAR